MIPWGSDLRLPVPLERFPSRCMGSTSVLLQPEVMIAHAAERFDATGNLLDKQAKDLIQQLLRNLVAWTRLLQQGQRERA